MALFEAAGVHLRFGDRVVLERSISRRPRANSRHHGAERRRQDDLLQRADRPRTSPTAARSCSTARTSPAARRRRIARLGVARSFQIMTLFDEFTALRERRDRAAGISRARGFDMRRARPTAIPAVAESASEMLDTRRPRRHAPTIRAKASALWRAPRARDRGGARAAARAAVPRRADRRPRQRRPRSGWPSWSAGSRASSPSSSIEHDMEFLFSLADDISVIHWGQVIARGTPAELQPEPWVKRSNLGRLA